MVWILLKPYVNTTIGAYFKFIVIKDENLKLAKAYMNVVLTLNAVGIIMYTMLSTRHDIAYWVGLVNRFMSIGLVVVIGKLLSGS